MEGKASYQATLLFPKKSTDFKAMKAAYEAALAKKWPGQRPPNLRSPFKDGDTETDADGNLLKEKYPEYAGMYFVRFKSYTQPGAKDRMGNVIPTECYKTEFYPGCIVRVSYGASAYNQSGNRGVSFWMNNIQKYADGPALGNAAPVDQDFMDDGPQGDLSAFGIEVEISGPGAGDDDLDNVPF